MKSDHLLHRANWQRDFRFFSPLFIIFYWEYVHLFWLLKEFFWSPWPSLSDSLARGKLVIRQQGTSNSLALVLAFYYFFCSWPFTNKVFIIRYFILTHCDFNLVLVSPKGGYRLYARPSGFQGMWLWISTACFSSETLPKCYRLGH